MADKKDRVPKFGKPAPSATINYLLDHGNVSVTAEKYGLRIIWHPYEYILKGRPTPTTPELFIRWFDLNEIRKQENPDVNHAIYNNS